MVSKKKKQDKFGKHKIAAIPVLLLILGYVLWGNSSPSAGQNDAQPTSSELADSSSSNSPNSAPGVEVANTQTSSGVGKGRTTRKTWPKPDLAFLSEPSLFQNFRYERELAKTAETLVNTQPEPERESPTEILQRVAAGLKRNSVPFAFRSRNKNIVMLGDRLLREGEEIQDDVYIRSIRGSDLVLEYRGSPVVD